MLHSKVVALLPMKGHSERVPGKNMREFCGRPLFHWIVDSLLGSQYVDYVVIDTDSSAIAADAQSCFEKVKIIVRPEAIRGDLIPMNAIIQYDLSQLPEEEYYLQTHSTNPLLTTATIDNAVETYFRSLKDYDALFSVTRLQSRLYWKDGRPINHDPRELLRTQDLNPVFEENSNLYIFSKSSFYLAGCSRLGTHPQMFEIGKMEAIDIDEETDFQIAEMLKQLGIK